MSTGIPFCDYTWNPASGCTKISEACENCYAEKQAYALQKKNTAGYKENGFKFTMYQSRIENLSHWKKGGKIFVGSMTDMFHEEMTFNFFLEVINIIERHPDNIFLFITKRPQKMKDFFSKIVMPGNIWLGVTAENQRRAEERIPILLSIPAAVHFANVEPILEKVNFEPFLSGENKLDWVLSGGETGENARPVNPSWVISLKDQCRRYNTPFFFASWGEYRIMPRTGVPTAVVEGTKLYRVGKYSTGNRIDGRVYNQFPVPRLMI